MTTLHKAAQQALEALEEYQSKGAPFLACDGAAAALRAALAQQDEPVQEPVAWIYQNMYTEQEYLVWKKGTGGRNWTPLYAAPPRCPNCASLEAQNTELDRKLAELDQEEPVQEPVQEHEDWCASVTQLLLSYPPQKAPCNCKPRHAEPVQGPVQEPVAWMCSNPELMAKGYERFSSRCEGDWNIPVYLSPPQRKPLTDDEIFAIENDIPDDVVSDRHWTIWYARAIERAHGIGEQP